MNVDTKLLGTLEAADFAQATVLGRYGLVEEVPKDMLCLPEVAEELGTAGLTEKMP